MEAGLDDPALFRSYPLASLAELGLCEYYFIHGFDLGVAVSIVPIDLSASSSVSAPLSSHIHGKRARKKVNSIMLMEEVVDHGVKSVTSKERGEEFHCSDVADDD